ncbi:MAG: hypothetical protein QXL01_05090, partial [Thermoplasmatales archaeon]
MAWRINVMEDDRVEKSVFLKVRPTLIPPNSTEANVWYRKMERLAGLSRSVNREIKHSQVRIPNILAYGIDFHGRSWTVQEYFDGKRLDQVPPSQIIANMKVLLGNCLESLTVLRDLGWVHRDVAPRNILVQIVSDSNIIVCLTDLELARRFEEERQGGTHITARHEETLNFYGTLLIRPETLPFADGYALGMVFLHIITGEHPVAISTNVSNKIFWKNVKRILDASLTRADSSAIFNVLRFLTNPRMFCRDSYQIALNHLSGTEKIPSFFKVRYQALIQPLQGISLIRPKALDRRVSQFEEICATNFLESQDVIFEEYKENQEAVIRRLEVIFDSFTEFENHSGVMVDFNFEKLTKFICRVTSEFLLSDAIYVASLLAKVPNVKMLYVQTLQNLWARVQKDMSDDVDLTYGQLKKLQSLKLEIIIKVLREWKIVNEEMLIQGLEILNQEEDLDHEVHGLVREIILEGCKFFSRELISCCLKLLCNHAPEVVLELVSEENLDEQTRMSALDLFLIKLSDELEKCRIVSLPLASYLQNLSQIILTLVQTESSRARFLHTHLKRMIELGSEAAVKVAHSECMGVLWKMLQNIYIVSDSFPNFQCFLSLPFFSEKIITATVRSFGFAKLLEFIESIGSRVHDDAVKCLINELGFSTEEKSLDEHVSEIIIKIGVRLSEHSEKLRQDSLEMASVVIERLLGQEKIEEAVRLIKKFDLTIAQIQPSRMIDILHLLTGPEVDDAEAFRNLDHILTIVNSQAITDQDFNYQLKMLILRKFVERAGFDRAILFLQAEGLSVPVEVRGELYREVGSYFAKLLESANLSQKRSVYEQALRLCFILSSDNPDLHCVEFNQLLENFFFQDIEPEGQTCIERILAAALADGAINFRELLNNNFFDHSRQQTAILRFIGHGLEFYRRALSRGSTDLTDRICEDLEILIILREQQLISNETALSFLRSVLDTMKEMWGDPCGNPKDIRGFCEPLILRFKEFKTPCGLSHEIVRQINIFLAQYGDIRDATYFLLMEDLYSPQDIENILRYILDRTSSAKDVFTIREAILSNNPEFLDTFWNSFIEISERFAEESIKFLELLVLDSELLLKKCPKTVLNCGVALLHQSSELESNLRRRLLELCRELSSSGVKVFELLLALARLGVEEVFEERNFGLILGDGDADDELNKRKLLAAYANHPWCNRTKIIEIAGRLGLSEETGETVALTVWSHFYHELVENPEKLGFKISKKPELQYLLKNHLEEVLSLVNDAANDPSINSDFLVRFFRSWLEGQPETFDVKYWECVFESVERIPSKLAASLAMAISESILQKKSGFIILPKNSLFDAGYVFTNLRENEKKGGKFSKEDIKSVKVPKDGLLLPRHDNPNFLLQWREIIQAFEDQLGH